ncbi:MAG: energy-coupling factor transporter ATPase [Saccharofermentans sp.]|nr:energy-coupling factor transporter ATPase [Saccharofermentans sp.]
MPQLTDDKRIIVDKVSFSYKSDDVSDSRPDKKALDGITLNIEKGSYTAVTGPNGSGKSTLAKLIDILEMPDEGRIVVFGKDTSSDRSFWDIRRKCSIIFQNPDNQIVGTTVEEDVAFGPENLGVPTDELRKRVDKALKDVGLYEYRERPSSALSGGQKQKLAIAGALAMHPDILIMDESTSMLDPHSRQEVLDIVEAMRIRDDLTLITITHDMTEAARCDRILVIKDGRVALEGTPAEVFSEKEKIDEMSLVMPVEYSFAYRLAELSGGTLSMEDLKDRESLKTACARELKKITPGSIKESPFEKKAEKDEVILQVKDLSYSYDDGKTYALEGIDLDVHKGEILVIAGRSGCGKTTLITHFNGILKAQKGSVTVNGIDSSDKKNVMKIRQKVGLVFQYPEYQLFDETVYKDICFGLKRWGVPENEYRERVNKACEMTGFKTTNLEKSPFELSGGQQRRAAIAGVLVMQPDILVMDEPGAGLDPAGRKAMFDMISRLRDSGVTVIIVSHNMDDSAIVADRVCYMRRGKIVKVGKPEEMFCGAENEFNIPRPYITEFALETASLAGIGDYDSCGDFTPEGEALALASYYAGGDHHDR